MSSKGNWYAEWFDETYLKLYSHRNDKEAIRFIKWLVSDFNFKDKEFVVDLACGAGRHTWAINGSTNWQTIGLDLSKPLLNKAIVETQSHYSSEKPLFLRSDIRHLPLLEEAFGLALCMFTSFGYFETEAEHMSTLTEIERVVKPDGIAVIDLLNPAFTIRNLVPSDSKFVDDLQVEQKRRFDSVTSRIIKNIKILDKLGNQRDVVESVKIFYPDELKNMFAKSKFELVKFIGDYDGSAFDEENSSRLIAILRKKS